MSPHKKKGRKKMSTPKQKLNHTSIPTSLLKVPAAFSSANNRYKSERNVRRDGIVANRPRIPWIVPETVSASRSPGNSEFCPGFSVSRGAPSALDIFLY